METKSMEHVSSFFTELIVNKLESFETDWRKSWIGLKSFRPRNISGRPYNSGNKLFLLWLCELKEYKLPVFMTFKKVRFLKVRVLHKEKAFPVYYWKSYIKHEELGEISITKYNFLPDTEKEKCKRRFFFKYDNVFNIDQTTFKNEYPEEYQKMLDEQAVIYPDSNNFVCEPLDDLLLYKKWDCPIRMQASDRAFYSPLVDFIVVPEKKQFKQGEEFYSTLLHEMGHSTGHAKRLGRKFGLKGTNEYAHEELIAELSAAISGSLLNISVHPQDNNIAYLKHWIEQLKKEPEYLFTILSSVNKVVAHTYKKLGIEVEASEEQNAITT